MRISNATAVQKQKSPMVSIRWLPHCSLGYDSDVSKLA